jgi:peptide/nickel transport system permease protein
VTAAYVVRRLATGILVLLAITLATFLVFDSIPVDPACFVVQCGRRGQIKPAERRAAHHVLGIDRPLSVQYAKFVWRMVRHASFGTSWRGVPIDSTLGKALGETASIVAGGVLVLLLLAIPLGTLSALRAQTLLDRSILAVSIVGIALHPFIIGTLLRRGLAETLSVFPDGGYYPLTGHVYHEVCVGTQPCKNVAIGGGPVDWAYHLVLPWVTFALFFLPLYTRIIRARVRETLGDPHVAVARAKGASELRVLRRHVLRIALLPLTTMVGLELGGALMASIYIEHIYGFNGLGSLTLNSLAGGQVGFDRPLIVAIFVVVAGAIVILNLVADLVHAWLDPRVRLTAKA